MRPITLSAIALVLLTTVAVAVIAHAAERDVGHRGREPRQRRHGARRLPDGRGRGGRTFDLLDATGDFVVNVAGGIAFGVVTALVLVQIFKWIVADDVVGVVLSLASGSIAYLPAEELGVSGVLAAVAVGLIVGRRSPEISTAAGRLRGYAFWEVLVFLLNATLFVLVGLQLPAILSEQEHSAAALVGLGVLVSLAVIATRLVWVFTLPYLIRALDRRQSQVARRTGWRCRATSPSAGC